MRLLSLEEAWKGRDSRTVGIRRVHDAMAGSPSEAQIATQDSAALDSASSEAGKKRQHNVMKGAQILYSQFFHLWFCDLEQVI